MHSDPIIDIFSDSSPSPSPASTPGRHVARRVKDEEARWRHDYFGRLEKMSREAVHNGHVLDWSDRNADDPKPWLWPLQEDGHPFPPSQLSKAFSHYEIPLPSCACATQEWDPRQDRSFRIWVVSGEESQYKGQVACGCRVRKEGCNIWISLTELFKHPDLLTFEYPRRSHPGSGIHAFNLYNTTVVEGQPSVSSPAHSALRTPTHAHVYQQPVAPSQRNSVTPASPYSPSKRRSGFKGRGTKTPSPPHRMSPRALEKILGAQKSRTHTPTPSTSAATLINHGDGLEAECGDPRLLETLRRCYSSSNESSPATTPDPVASSSKTAQPPAYNPNENRGRPGDRLALDMENLEPTLPDPLLLFIRNRHLAPYTGESLQNALEWLKSDKGLEGKHFWRTFDQCNCGNFFFKTTLENDHGPKCLCWTYTDSEKREKTTPYLPPPSNNPFV